MAPNGQETYSAWIICRGCGSKNTITAARLPTFERITCSHCGLLLGTWGTLVAVEGVRPRQTENGIVNAQCRSAADKVPPKSPR